MKEWTYKASYGCNFGLRGETLAEAIVAHWKGISRDLYLGNAAGYRLHSVRAEYKEGILGGKGGIVLRIEHSGTPLASGCAKHAALTKDCPCTPPRNVSEAWIYGEPEDCPEPVDIQIRA